MNIDEVERLNRLSISDYSKALYKHKLIEGITKAIESPETSYKDATRGVPKAYIREFAGGKNPYLLFMKNTVKESPTSIHAGMVLADKNSDHWVSRNSEEGKRITAARKAKRTKPKIKPARSKSRLTAGASNEAEIFLTTGKLA